jgi:hypothetical protein
MNSPIATRNTAKPLRSAEGLTNRANAAPANTPPIATEVNMMTTGHATSTCPR